MKENKNKLRDFFNSASQRGYSGQVTAGAVPINAASDHIPIMWKDNNSDLNVLSWNMLSDDHLYNSFLNVANINNYQEELKKDDSLKDNYYSKKMNMFFYELSEYARQKQGLDKDSDGFQYSQASLDEFLASDFFFPKPRTDEDKALRKRAREEMIGWFNNLPERAVNNGLSKQDFSLSVAHSLQILHHIEYGGLKWSSELGSRKEQVESMEVAKTMQNTLNKDGFICLQECTDPNVLLQIRQGNNKYKVITHNVREGSKDNCVIMYNSDLYELEDTKKLELAHDKKKPAILAKFSRKEDGSKIIIGSIHHPGGGKENDMPIILDALDQLKAGEEMRVVVTGDFNNTKDHFSSKMQDSKLNIFAAEGGTMSANDFGSRNKSIDLVFSNISDASVRSVDNFMKRNISATANVAISVNLDNSNIITLGEKKVNPNLAVKVKKTSSVVEQLKTVLKLRDTSSSRGTISSENVMNLVRSANKASSVMSI